MRKFRRIAPAGPRNPQQDSPQETETHVVLDSPDLANILSARGISVTMARAKVPQRPQPQDTRGTLSLLQGRTHRTTHTCTVCDKEFLTSDFLATHLVTHRDPDDLPFRCNLCHAHYKTKEELAQHKQVYHQKYGDSEMVLPVVDLNQQDTVTKLGSLGINHFIPLSQLQIRSGGIFGLPIVPIHNAQNPAVCNLGALGASNIMSIGPIEAVLPQ